MIWGPKKLEAGRKSKPGVWQGIQAETRGRQIGPDTSREVRELAVEFVEVSFFLPEKKGKTFRIRIPRSIREVENRRFSKSAQEKNIP